MESIGNVAKRFRTRLRLSLDELGFTPLLRDRSRELAFRLAIHESSAAELLAHGDSVPDIPLLLKICDLTQKPLSWFLEEHDHSFPASTRIVQSIGPGEDFAISLPSDIAGTVAGIHDELFHYRSRGEMGFGVQGGDYVITVEVPVHPMSVTKNQLYLIGSKPGFELRNCVAQSPLRASFSSFDGKTTYVLKPTIAAADRRSSNFQEEGLGEGMHHFSQVVCVLKAPKNIPKDGTALLLFT